MDVSPRLARWVRATFPAADADAVLAELAHLPPVAVGRQDPERIHAALVITTAGDRERFEGMRALALQDWRDALVAGGLAEPDWPARLDRVLGRI